MNRIGPSKPSVMDSRKQRMEHIAASRPHSLVRGLPEQFYGLLADSIPQMIWSVRHDGYNEYCNRRMYEYTGLAPEQLVAWGWQAIIHPEDRDRCEALWRDALARGSRYEVECRLRRHDGAYLWHLSTAEPVLESGRIARWFGSCTNIEPRKEAERELVQAQSSLAGLVESRTAALRTSESRLRAIIENEPECVKLLDARGVLLDMNSAGLDMIQADNLEQVKGECIYGLVAADYRDAFGELTERVCRGERGTLEFELVGLKGARRWMQTHAAPFRDEASGRTVLLAITRDISEKKRAEMALAESEARFRSFMDNLPAVAWIKDSRLRYTWVSAQYERVHGKMCERIVGRDDFEVWPPDLAAQFRRLDQQALQENGPVQSVHGVPRGDGSKADWLVVKFPLPDAIGKRGVGGIRVDITERVALERVAVENRARIENAAQVVRQLMNRLVHVQEAERHKLAGDLHDLIGQKLTALGINLEFVRQKMPQAGATAVAPRLHQMSTLLGETIGAIREVMSDLKPQVLDEHGLLAALFQYAATFEARTGLRAQVTGPEPRLPLPRDVAIALFRIAQEALTNAAKHSGASRVLVRVRKDPRGVELEVEDDGRGLGGTGPSASGGWGLRMMRERAEAAGGALELASTGRGTRIAVSIPLEHADQGHPG